jgi:hypothetical protein
MLCKDAVEDEIVLLVLLKLIHLLLHTSKNKVKLLKKGYLKFVLYNIFPKFWF